MISRLGIILCRYFLHPKLSHRKKRNSLIYGRSSSHEKKSFDLWKILFLKIAKVLVFVVFFCEDQVMDFPWNFWIPAITGRRRAAQQISNLQNAYVSFIFYVGIGWDDIETSCETGEYVRLSNATNLWRSCIVGTNRSQSRLVVSPIFFKPTAVTPAKWKTVHPRTFTEMKPKRKEI